MSEQGTPVTGQTHWENGSNGQPVQTANAQPMNNDQQLQAARQALTRSLPIDKLAQYKEAIASGDPDAMAKFREGLTPNQTKLANEIQARDPATMFKTGVNLAVATGILQGTIDIGQSPGGFAGALLNPATHALTMSNAPAPTLEIADPSLGVTAPGLATPGIKAPQFVPGAG